MGNERLEPGAPDSPGPAQRPDDLNRIERQMLNAAEAGEPCGPPGFDAWEAPGIPPTIRAAVLRRLLVEDGWPVHAKGVHLRGIPISGRLDLEGATLRCPLRLERCRLDRDIILRYATVSVLAINACELSGLIGDSLVVTKELDLAESTFTGSVRLLDADVNGEFSCRDATLTRTGPGNTLVAERMRVKGRINLNGMLTSGGAVRLAGADVTGQVSCRGAHLNGINQGQSMVADAMKIGGGLYLDGEFSSSGTISLRSADIGGILSCGNASLEGTHDGNSLLADGIKIGGDLYLNGDFWSAAAIRLIGAEIKGELNCSGASMARVRTGRGGGALIADGVKVGGDVFLESGFSPGGVVRLPGADIAGQLTMRGARLVHPSEDGVALLADRAMVGGDIFLERHDQRDDVPFDDRSGFLSTGTLSLKHAQVGVSLSFKGAVLDVPADHAALNADGIRIGGSLSWRPATRVLGRVSLKGASAAELDDNWKKRDNGYWPPDIRLDGFSYATISADDNPATVKQRLDWIRGQRRGTTWRRARRVDGAGPGTGYASGPYEQLFEVYERTGNDTDARQVAIVQRRDQRKFGLLRLYRKLFNQLLDYSIGYGYRTWQALLMLIVLYAAVLVITVFAARHNGSFVPVPQNAGGIRPVPSVTSCQQSYPCFHALGYTFDAVVPIINLHQADYWRPNDATGWGEFCTWISWFGTISGWLLATLAVAGYTGLARRVDASGTQ